MRARLRHAPPGREAIRRDGKRDERRREKERGGGGGGTRRRERSEGGERSEGTGGEEEEGGEQGCNKGRGGWRRGGVRMDVESDGGGAV